ncbi:MAG: hypothetical protein KKD55_00895 [Candidatus Omnitrophica bacterium]|nr:hypothetical protein [Candidatus Omnitrophota bacterium]
MSEEELIRKNIELSTEFGKYLLDNPELAEKISPEAVIVFVDESNPELSKYNLSLAEKAEREGQPIVQVQIKGLAPEVTRLLQPHLVFSR